MQLNPACSLEMLELLVVEKLLPPPHSPFIVKLRWQPWHTPHSNQRCDPFLNFVTRTTTEMKLFCNSSLGVKNDSWRCRAKMSQKDPLKVVTWVSDIFGLIPSVKRQNFFLYSIITKCMQQAVCEAWWKRRVTYPFFPTPFEDDANSGLLFLTRKNNNIQRKKKALCLSADMKSNNSHILRARNFGPGSSSSSLLKTA